jgi:hypothetical protein
MEHEEGKHERAIEAVAITGDLTHLWENTAKFFQVLDHIIVLPPDTSCVRGG